MNGHPPRQPWPANVPMATGLQPLIYAPPPPAAPPRAGWARVRDPSHARRSPLQAPRDRLRGMVLRGHDPALGLGQRAAQRPVQRRRPSPREGDLMASAPALDPRLRFP